MRTFVYLILEKQSHFYLFILFFFDTFEKANNLVPKNSKK